MPRLADLLSDGLGRGLYSGALAAVRRSGDRTFASVGTLAFTDPTPTTRSSLFDLASLTKSYVAIAVMRLADQGTLSIDEPVESLLPGAPRIAAEISLRDLLSHTAGMAPTSEIWRDPGIPQTDRLRQALETPVVAPPRTRFIYSCVGYLWVGAVIEAVTSQPLRDALDSLVLAPLGLAHTGFGPVPAANTLATEDQSSIGRGMVRGHVHDELSWFLGGATGNAGLFGPAYEVLTMAESFADGRLLSRAAIAEMTRSYVPRADNVPFGHGLGVRLGDEASMGTAQGFGHTGFTGTLWIADPEAEIEAVLLTNRVHPDRNRASVLAFRREFVDAVRRG